MSWWIILLIIIGVFVIYDLAVGRKERHQREEKEKEKEVFRRIAASQQKKRDEYLTRLNTSDENVAQRIQKLFLSASYHESRNVTAFHNILKELSQIREEILNNGGRERMKIITDRVEYLCGDNMPGFYEYLAILTQVHESSGMH
ncbi:MAG: hypothetical protein HZB42_00830 [Sphingobacteriales bacterium]|nr:hypothetical protein [Sphingobacteriales bacterium]